MKTIKVTDEVYEFLLNLSKELNKQDNRCTRDPYFFQIQETIKIAVPEYCGEQVWVQDGEICLVTDDDIKEAVFECKEWDIDSNKDKEKYEELSILDIEEILEVNYRKGYVDTDFRYSNAFLTEKAAKEHIRANKHNLKQPVDYLQYAYRNPELEQLIIFLKGLTKEDI